MQRLAGLKAQPAKSSPTPSDLIPAFNAIPKAVVSYGFSWTYPQHNFYGMWSYALIFPDQASKAYDLAKSKLIVPLPAVMTTDYIMQKPYELNAYIAGYVGFLKLQELAGKTVQDGQLRTTVTNELNRIYQLRANTFTKDTYWVEDGYHRRSLNVARNFMMLVPELGDYLHQNISAQVQEALNEYQYVAPYWFVARYEFDDE